MNGPLFRHSLRDLRLRAAILTVAAFGWGWLMVLVYTSFAPGLRQMMQVNPLIERFSQFGSGNFFTLPGALTLGFQHPFLIAVLGVVAVGASAGAIAGERQAGTLELLLARPISRWRVYVSILLAQLLVVALLVLATIVGMTLGVVVHDMAGEVQLARMPLVFANGLLQWAAFAAVGLAASVSFDRPGPALGVSLAFLIANYFLEVLGSLWAPARWMQDLSLFRRFRADDLLTGSSAPLDFAILGGVLVAAVAYAWFVFPRRDLAAPS